ncbi:DUF6037 family protein [[Pseudomonas] boreopolis]|uniref:DUF6037 family protein n=1 Tax=Xanthomonas boreopolis TaxID=86183 RepID=UPI003D9B9CB1
MLRMPGLARLHAAMRAARIERVRFRIEHNHLSFEGVFLTDVQPWEFALACVGRNLVLLFHVNRRYEIDAYLGDTYAPLAEALGTGAGSGQPLRSSDFLREIDAKLPHTVTAGDKATPADVVRVVRDVEDADKVHFVRFIPHARDGQRHVTEANLAKTRKLMGQHIHDWCQRNNVSTGGRMCRSTPRCRRRLRFGRTTTNSGNSSR